MSLLERMLWIGQKYNANKIKERKNIFGSHSRRYIDGDRFGPKSIWYLILEVGFFSPPHPQLSLKKKIITNYSSVHYFIIFS